MVDWQLGAEIQGLPRWQKFAPEVTPAPVLGWRCLEPREPQCWRAKATLGKYQGLLRPLPCPRTVLAAHLG
jgi:hypothetical protein